jgi:hypothetical protein
MLLLVAIMAFHFLKPMTGPSPGGGLPIFWVTLAIFVAISAWAVWGPDRVRPNGEAVAILDLRLAFATRLAIHLFFLAALVLIGLAVSEPVLLFVALGLLLVEAPLSILASRRHSSQVVIEPEPAVRGRA